jgi:hypothetical protein
MRWLTAILVVLLLGLAAFPTVVGTVSGWIAHRSEHVRSIDYLPREIDEISASRRRAGERPAPDRKSGDAPD